MTKSWTHNRKKFFAILFALGLLVGALIWALLSSPALAFTCALSTWLMFLFYQEPQAVPPLAADPLAQVDTLLLDQPPVVEAGTPEIKAIRSIDSKVSDLALLQRVASLEKNNNHPLALAVLQAAKAKRLELLDVTHFKTLEGGVAGFVSDRKMVVGSAALLRQEGINPGPLESLASNLLREGYSVALIAAEGRPIGLISAQVATAPQNNLNLSELQNRGFSVVQAPHNLTVAQKEDLHKKLTEQGAKVAATTLEGLEELLKKIEGARQQTKSSTVDQPLSFAYKSLALPAIAFLCGFVLENFLSPMMAALAGLLAAILALVFLRRHCTSSNAMQ